jgi:crotonobetainyl-CoA:carnitine CoA-transferase CaiB-like acyl-CoA transferase
VPGSALRSVGEAMESDEVRSLGIIGEARHEKLGTAPNVALPLTFSETPLRKPRGAPLLGAQSKETLRRMLGCNEEHLEQLVRAGAFGGRDGGEPRSLPRMGSMSEENTGEARNVQVRSPV